MVNDMLVEQVDIVSSVGPMVAFSLEDTVPDLDGSIKIDLVAVLENPKISGFEVVEVFDFIPPTASPTQKSSEVALINCGGGSFVDSQSRVWSADDYFVGGVPYTDGSNNIVGTSDDFLYHSERFGFDGFSYEIPLPAGTYDVILYFAELFWEGEGQRLFNVDVEGSTSFTNVDIVALGNGERLQPVELVAENIALTDGSLTISFSSSVPKVDNAKISAIIVREV